jgi:U3 small nucleolar RNA-associated protein 13
MTIMAHRKYINVIKVAPNDKLIASASQDKTIKIWEASNLNNTLTLSGHKRGVWDIAFSPTEKVLVSGSGDMLIKTWNLSTGACLATLQGHTDQLVRISWINHGL